MKLQDLLKDIELGKVYTDKDKPPFKVEEGKLQENEKNWNWSLDWESDISSLINSRELKTLMRDKNSKVKTIAQRLQKNLKQVHIGFDGLTDELRKVYGEGKLSEMKVNKGKVDKTYKSVLNHMRKVIKKLNDDEMYEVTTKLKQWFNKNIM